MNNHYPYGYPPYPGQPPAQPQQQQPYSYPIPPLFAQYPQHNENTFDAVSHTQPAYEQNQNMIPGLGGYGHLPQLPQLQGFGWQQSHEQQPAPQHHWQAPRDGPNLIPASQYYQADNVPMPKAPVASGALPPTAPKRSTKQTSNDAEEGELSDGELDDVYEPQETLPEANSRQQRRNAPNAANANARNGKSSLGYPIASSYGGPKDGGMKHPAGGNDREHSGSYSPHLSPHEIHPRMTPNNQHGASSSQTHVSGGQFNQPVATAASQQQQGKNAVEDARQRARSAISNLWPLGVRRQDFVDEGIDKTVVDNLLTDLKLDTKAPSQFSIPGLSTPASLPGLSYASGQPASQQARTSGPALPPKPPAQQQSSPSAVKSAGEERKDRIARLLAAKGAKTTASSSTNTGAQAGASNDKTLVQQQKMDALQKSREARAQKAADRKGSLQSSQSKEASPVDPSRRPQSAAANVPVVVPASHLARPNALQQSADRQTAPASAIPGLFTSAPQPAPIINQRKRPVASDFVANPYANKRPFGHTQQDTRFVIDVSEGSDDEDVEMEIGSPTDEPSSTQQDTPSLRPASFRDFPPLSNGLQRQLSSPAPSNVTTPQSGAVGSQPKQAHIDVMDKQIEAMKRKIALAEARAKLKAAMGEKSLGQKSAGQTLDTPLDSDGGKPSMRRVQSMGDSHASDPPNGQQSPAIAEPSSSMRLPKPSDNRIQGDSSRSQKLRTVSTNLPLLENRLQTKKSKLRLLQIQMSRLEHEIREEETEKHKLTEEMEQLEQDSDESSEPQNQLKSNSVDPVATATSTVPQSEMQTPLPAAADAEQSSSKVAEQSSSAASVRRSKSPAMSLDKDASDAADDAENAVTGKAATSPSQVPPSTETPMPALHETPTSPETAGDDDAITSDDASDVAMAESDDSSSSEPEHEDDYEPAENVVPAAAAKSPSTSPVAAESAVSLVNSDTDSQQPSARASQIPEQISLGVNESTPEQDVNAAPLATQSTDEASSSGERFTPYESPLQYFRAYRYHPKFAETVPGGLRSLTYSNRIDPNLPICPDQLASRECPRGADCIYQHFESMKLPDDQILLQLGGTTLEGPEKTQFNDGLRKLLQEMRSQNIKDFPSIAKGIVEYHNRFTGDPSKILPLGNVSI